MISASSFVEIVHDNFYRLSMFVKIVLIYNLVRMIIIIDMRYPYRSLILEGEIEKNEEKFTRHDIRSIGMFHVRFRRLGGRGNTILSGES